MAKSGKKAVELTYNQFIGLANKYYDKGGDSYVECWDEQTFRNWVNEFGPVTLKQALKWFRTNLSEEREQIAMMENGWW